MAAVETSLRFRVAEVGQSLDLTIRGPFFFERGKAADWAWEEFFLNGVRWKGRRPEASDPSAREGDDPAPRHPPDRGVRVFPDGRDDRRRPPGVPGRLRPARGGRPTSPSTAARPGSTAETFALLRRDSIQLNLKGDTLSNVQTEYYRPVPGAPGVVLPLEIRGQQVFSTAGRTTAIERDVLMTDVVVDPPDFEARRAEAYASESQMVRDTDQGMRYLVPDGPRPERGSSRRSSVAQEHLRPGRRASTDGSGLPVPAPRDPALQFRPLEEEQAALVLLRRRAALRQLHRPFAPRARGFDLGADIFGGRLSVRRRVLPQRGRSPIRAHQAPPGVRPGQRRPSIGTVPEGLARPLHAVGQLPAGRRHRPERSSRPWTRSPTARSCG